MSEIDNNKKIIPINFNVNENFQLNGKKNIYVKVLHNTVEASIWPKATIYLVSIEKKKKIFVKSILLGT